jgi:alkylation response protein AidB-like acyl-CoA dehydrogenase
VDRKSPDSSRMETMAKLNASMCAVRVAEAARTVHGADSIVRGRRIEKLLRDTACLMHLGGGLHAGRAHLGAADHI